MKEFCRSARLLCRRLVLLRLMRLRSEPHSTPARVDSAGAAAGAGAGAGVVIPRVELTVPVPKAGDGRSRCSRALDADHLIHLTHLAYRSQMPHLHVSDSYLCLCSSCQNEIHKYATMLVFEVGFRVSACCLQVMRAAYCTSFYIVIEEATKQG